MTTQAKACCRCYYYYFNYLDINQQMCTTVEETASSTGKDLRNVPNKTVTEKTKPHSTTSRHPSSSSREDKSVATSKTMPKSTKKKCEESMDANHDSDGVAKNSFQKASNGNNHESNDNKQLIPINIVFYKGVKYDMTKALSTDSQLVKDQVRNVEELNIENLRRDLSSVGKFVRLACCGVVGHAELQIKTREVLIHVGDITDETYHTLKNFERTSNNALQTMNIAYGYLKENLEGEAFKMFTQIGEKSEEMCKISEALSDRCMKESTKVKNLGYETLKEKEATEAQKNKTDKLVKQSRDEKTYQEQIKVKSVEKADKKEKEIKDTSKDIEKAHQDKKDLIKKTQNRLQHEHKNIVNEKAELKSKYEDDDKEILNEVKKCQLKFESALLSNKKSYEQELQEIESAYKQKIKSVEDDYDRKITQNEKVFQDTKNDNQKLFDQKCEEHKEDCDKKVSDAETKYRITIENINKEYQESIQASDLELENTLKLVTQKLEAALEANKKIYSAKVKACIDEEVAIVNTEWSTKDAEERKIKTEKENSAKSDKISAQKTAQLTRDAKLNEVSEDKQSKIVKVETDTLSNRESDEQIVTKVCQNFKENDEDAQDDQAVEVNEELSAEEKKVKSESKNLEESDSIHALKRAQQTRDKELNKAFQDKQSKILKAETDTLVNRESDEQKGDQNFEEKIKSDKDAEIKQIKEDFKEEKGEKKEVCEQNDKDIKDACDNMVSDAENEYEDVKNLIEKEYQDAIQVVSDDKLKNKLTIAQQKLDAALEANKQQYNSRRGTFFWYWKRSEPHEEWSKKNAEDQRLKIETDDSAKTANTEAHKLAKETKQRKLEEAFKTKQEKVDKAKTLMRQKLESNKQILEEFDKAHKEQIKQKEKEFQEAKQKYEERQKEQKRKRVTDAETEYQFNIKRIEKEYQDAIQTSNAELDNKIKLIALKLETALEANKQTSSAKMNPLKDKEKVEMDEERSKKDAEEKGVKSETEYCVRPNNTKTHKIDKLLNIESDEQTLTNFDKKFEEKIDDEDDEKKKINDYFKRAKREKETLYEQNNKDIKHDYDKIVTDADKEYKDAEKLIEEEYQGEIQASNDELNNELKMPQQKLDAALEANEQMYQTKVDHSFCKSLMHEEQSKKDTEEQELKIKIAKPENTKAHKIAQETKQRKLEKAFENKKDKVDKAKTHMSQKMLLNMESHKQALEELYKAHTEKMKSTENTYRKKHKLLRIEKEYQDAIQASNVEFHNKVKLATQMLETALEANKQIYRAKIKTTKVKVEIEVREEWSKKDAEEKRTKSETENCARSDNISAHKKAQDTRDDKLKKAFKSKQDSIGEAEKKKNQKNEAALKERQELNNDAAEKKKHENAIAKTNKNEEISQLKKEKEADMVKADKKKKINDESTKNIKQQEDKENESRKKDLQKWYKEQLYQKDNNLKKKEKVINDECKKDLELINENLKNLNAQKEKYESEIQNSEEQTKLAIENLIKLSQQIKDNDDLSKGQAASIEFLHEAQSVLCNIQTIMKKASNFWREVHDHCEDMTKNGLLKQVKLMKTSDTVSRQRLWKGDTFKEAALDYQGQWYALKDVCAKTRNDISLVQEEINQYICENPTKEEAIILVQKLAADLLGSARMREILDKPADT